MRTRLVVGLVVGALGMVATACSSTSSGGAAPTPPDSTVEVFCTDWATAVCQLSTFCQFDAAACATHQTSVCSAFATSATTSGFRQYSQPAGKACIDALTSAYGGNPSVISAATLTQLDATCNAAFAGSAASDKPCTSDYDCATGLTCSLIPGQSASVCGSGSPVAAGGTCLATSQCPANYYCAPVMGANPQCVATPTTGGACSGAIPCGADDFCGPSGTCQAKAAQGQTCSASSDCASAAPYCDTYPPAACVSGLTFARGSIDCNGIAGLDTTPVDAGGGGSETGAGDSGTAGD
jgi:hypothetical protein